MNCCYWSCPLPPLYICARYHPCMLSSELHNCVNPTILQHWQGRTNNGVLVRRGETNTCTARLSLHKCLKPFKAETSTLYTTRLSPGKKRGMTGGKIIERPLKLQEVSSIFQLLGGGLQSKSMSDSRRILNPAVLLMIPHGQFLLLL